jgi:hypothetical protein
MWKAHGFTEPPYGFSFPYNGFSKLVIWFQPTFLMVVPPGGGQDVIQMKTTSIMVLAALAATGLLLSAGVVGATDVPSPGYGPYHSDERHELMEKAFEENDYEAWKTLMTENGRRPRVVDMVTDETFGRFSKVHEAMESGDLDLAATIRAELGLGQGRGRGYGRGGGMNGGGFVDADGDGQCDNIAAGGCGGCGRGRGWRFQQ